jgi:hypothetical protein
LTITASAMGLSGNSDVTLDLHIDAPLELEINAGNVDTYFTKEINVITGFKMDPVQTTKSVLTKAYETDPTYAGFDILSFDGYSFGNNALYENDLLSDADVTMNLKFTGTNIAIGDSAFEKCNAIREIEVATTDNAITLGNSSFISCQNVSGFSNAADIDVFLSADAAFANCPSLTADGIHVKSLQ